MQSYWLVWVIVWLIEEAKESKKRMAQAKKRRSHQRVAQAKMRRSHQRVALFHILNQIFSETYDRRARPTARKQAEKITLFSKKNRVTVKSHLSKRGKYEFDHVSVDIIDTQSNISRFFEQLEACSWTLSIVCLVLCEWFIFQ